MSERENQIVDEGNEGVAEAGCAGERREQSEAEWM